MTATGENDGERLRTIDTSERAALYARRTAANGYEQAFGGFLNRVDYMALSFMLLFGDVGVHGER